MKKNVAKKPKPKKPKITLPLTTFSMLLVTITIAHAELNPSSPSTPNNNPSLELFMEQTDTALENTILLHG